MHIYNHKNKYNPLLTAINTITMCSARTIRLKQERDDRESKQQEKWIKKSIQLFH
jgi:hypothetical protein